MSPAGRQKNGDKLRNPTLGNRVWATFFTYKGREEEWEGKVREGEKEEGAYF